MRPPEEEGLPIGEPPAVDTDRWNDLKRRFRADAERAAARRHLIEASEEQP